MEAPLKQRLIGAIVLAALALIFVPMLLRSPDVRDPDSADVALKIPDEPDIDGIKTIDIPLDQPLSAAPVAEPAPLPVEPVSADSDASVAAGQYALIIAVSDKTQAESVAKTLQAQNLAPLIQSNGQRYRIRIGPYASREQAEAARLRSATVVAGGTVVALDAPAPAPVAAPNNPPATPLAAPASVAVASAAVEKPVLKAEPAVTASGFAVQIGAPANEQSAQTLRDKARAAGFSSFIQPVETDSGRRYRVRIGPEHSRDAANTLLAAVKLKTGIDGIVVKHP